jgi:hypothetical protein
MTVSRHWSPIAGNASQVPSHLMYSGNCHPDLTQGCKMWEMRTPEVPSWPPSALPGVWLHARLCLTQLLPVIMGLVRIKSPWHELLEIMGIECWAVLWVLKWAPKAFPVFPHWLDPWGHWGQEGGLLRSPALAGDQTSGDSHLLDEQRSRYAQSVVTWVEEHCGLTWVYKVVVGTEPRFSLLP